MRSSVYPKEKIEKERKFGAGRHFKLDTRDRFLMLLVIIVFTLPTH